MKARLILLGLIIIALAVLGTAEAEQKPILESKITAISDEGEAGAPNQVCSSNQANQTKCRAFINGFIQGALLTDAAIIQSLGTQQNKSSFTERALRTRMPRQGDKPATALAGFCLPPEKSMKQIVNEVYDHIAATETDPKTLAKGVYGWLKKDYLCNQ